MRKLLPLLFLVVALTVPAPAQADWSDNFDTYALGSGLHGQGDWHGWDGNVTADAYVSNVQSLSAPHSVSVAAASDIVHEYSGYTSGVWAFTTWQYIPSGFTGTTYFILLNTYNNGGPYNWSTQIQFNYTNGRVIFDPDAVWLPMIRDQWVELKVVIDLNANLQTVFYGGTQLIQKSWTEGNSGGGALNIAAVDLYANNASPVYYDDMSLAPPPPPPPEGACCFPDGSCVITIQADCASGDWTEGGLCSPNPCEQPPPIGACCDESTFNCVMTAEADCVFHWLGAGVPCTPETCGPPVPVERKSWGQIKSEYR